MSESKINHRSVLRKWWIRGLILLTTGLLLNFILDVTFSLIYRNNVLLGSYLGYIYSSLGTWMGGEGFRLVVRRLNNKYGWEKRFSRRLVMEILAAVLISIWISLGIRWLFVFAIEPAPYIQFSDELIIVSLGIVVALGFVLIDMSVYLFREWRHSITELERFRKESAESRFETLRSQVNPHFLFNNLNTLSSLVYENPEKAGLFIREMADVYRYILDTREKDTVALRKELDFIRSYLYLLQIRFENRLIVEWDIPDGIGDRGVVPATLQLLVENVIKHNVITAATPLSVRICLESGDYLVVSNDLRKKEGVENSSGFGLRSITSRYTYLTEKPVLIHADNQRFTVKIPLI